MIQRLSPQDVAHFQKQVLSFYHQNKRVFPFRDINDPYKIVVSEYMLQQTQTARVVPFFIRFIERFPTVQSLATAPLGDVLTLWQGLGYNRRAKFLQKCAIAVVSQFDGVFPSSLEELQSLPGIGAYTASAVVAFAFETPVMVIETNIRAVFIHTFFPDDEKIEDNLIIPLIEQTLPQNGVREWYYALMDYGVDIKKRHKNPARRSKHHAKQSPFLGSNRQKRGLILRELVTNKTVSVEELCSLLQCEPQKAEEIAAGLEKEGLIIKEGRVLYLP
ncbi:A/G-specific adenine glycosylase [bacterium]|nr:A/G-specific adenine glycosylase [bacterium]